MKKTEDVLEQLEKKRRKRRRYGFLVAFFVLLAGLVAIHIFRNDLFPREPDASPPVTLPSAPVETTPPDTEPAVSVTQPQSTETEATEPPAELRAQTLLKTMTLHEKVCQLFFVRPEALSATCVTAADETLWSAMDNTPVGGIVLFSGNIQNTRQCTDFIQSFQSAAEIPLFTGIDEEGGSVSRLASNPDVDATVFPPMGEIGATLDTQKSYDVGFTIGTEIRALGFNLDFAPVADVNTNPQNPVIGDRAFSSDPEIAADMVSACVWGFYDARVVSCLKHFPGHGDTATDTHHGYAESLKTTEELWQAELLPFQSGIRSGAPMVMAGHIACPQITGTDTPATLSSVLIQELLRQALDFDGVVITDSMEMEAITRRYDAGEAAVLALEAGCDAILLPEDLEKAITAVEEALASGRLTEERIDESVLRILELKIQYGIIT